MCDSVDADNITEDESSNTEKKGEEASINPIDITINQVEDESVNPEKQVSD